MRVIIRRPHAYEFARTYRGAQTPGITILSSNGKFKDAFRLPSGEAIEDLLQLLRGAKKKSKEKR